MASNHHRHLTWYYPWDVAVFSTPPDGNCLFHAILFSLGRKDVVVSELRQLLADRLHRHYDSLHNGEIRSFSESVPEFSLERMEKELRSNRPIGYGYISFIADQIDRDIYVIDGMRRTLYRSDEVTVKGRRAIVVFYANGHYESVGARSDRYASFDVDFHPGHEFIRTLQS
jgi:hypothetical protein